MPVDTSFRYRVNGFVPPMPRRQDYAADAGGAVEWRTTRLVARSMRGTPSSVPAAARNTTRAASSPMRRNGWCTVVRAGEIQAAMGMSS